MYRAWVYREGAPLRRLLGAVLAMTDRVIEVEQDGDDEPVPPLKRNPSLLDGIAKCAECGENMIGVIDANGVEWYTHESEVEE